MLNTIRINDDGSNTFSVMTTNNTLNPKVYLKTLSRLSFGLYAPKLIKK